jgi:hypothetical protein
MPSNGSSPIGATAQRCTSLFVQRRPPAMQAISGARRRQLVRFAVRKDPGLPAHFLEVAG